MSGLITELRSGGTVSSLISTISSGAIRRLSDGKKARILRLLAAELGIDGFQIRGENGTMIAPSFDEIITGHYLLERTWDPMTVSLIRETLDDGGVLIDIGANIGLITCPVAALENVTVHAFEPHPANFAMLRANCALNDVVDSVYLYPVALSDAPGDMTLELSPNNSGDHRLRSSDGQMGDNAYGETGRRTVSVAVRRLDDLVSTETLVGAVVVKLDVQGAEHLVLSGGRNVLARTDVLVIEFWPYGIRRLGGDPDEVLATLFQAFSLVSLWSGAPEDVLALQETNTSARDAIQRLLDQQGATGHVDLVFTSGG